MGFSGSLNPYLPALNKFNRGVYPVAVVRVKFNAIFRLPFCSGSKTGIRDKFTAKFPRKPYPIRL